MTRLGDIYDSGFKKSISVYDGAKLKWHFISATKTLIIHDKIEPDHLAPRRTYAFVIKSPITNDVILFSVTADSSEEALTKVWISYKWSEFELRFNGHPDTVSRLQFQI